MQNFNRSLLSLIILTLAAFLVREISYQSKASNRGQPITVYVSGEVRYPGTVTLPVGARRIHALVECGGALPGVDVSGLEPAKHLEDGQTLLVQKRSRPQVQRSPKVADMTESSKSGKIDINRATTSELQALPGVGPVLAKRIVAARRKTTQGTFASLEDLTAIRGIKKKTLARLTPYLDLEGP